MGVTSEVEGVTLRYVARAVEGTITTHTAKRDDKLGETVLTETKIKDPVIVFFPNKSIQVMSGKEAQQKGFLHQPEVLNLAHVQEGRTPAARYRYGIRMEDRMRAWLDLENAVINKCISSKGHPLPLDVMYSDKSLYITPTDQLSEQMEMM